MTTPSVCAVMLTADRPEMTARAVQSFANQTYENKWLLIFDTSRKAITRYRGHFQHCEIGGEVRTVGHLRNAANAMCRTSEIIVHFDSDDYSHPRRIEEQVALLQASGKACVGYRSAMFWDTRSMFPEMPQLDQYTGGDAWIYSNPDTRYCLGASMCYWREAWKAQPFAEETYGDEHWRLANQDKCVGYDTYDLDDQPRLICGIHGGNTSAAYSAEQMANECWTRAPWLDEHVQERMKL